MASEPDQEAKVDKENRETRIEQIEADLKGIGRKSSIEILYSRAHARSFLVDSEVIGLDSTDGVRSDLILLSQSNYFYDLWSQRQPQTRQSGYEFILENLLQLKLLSSALQEDCRTLNSVFSDRIEEQYKGSDLSQIQGWLFLYQEAIARIMQFNRREEGDFAGGSNQFPPPLPCSNEEFKARYRWESHFPEQLRQLRENFASTVSSSHQLLVQYKLLKNNLDKVYHKYVSKLRPVVEVKEKRKKDTLSNLQHNVQSEFPTVTTEEKSECKENYKNKIQKLFIHFGLDGICLKTNWKSNFLKFSKLAKQTEKLSMLEVFLWKINKQNKMSLDILEEMSIALVGEERLQVSELEKLNKTPGKAFSPTRFICVKQILENVKEILKRRKKYELLPKQVSSLMDALDEAKEEFDMVENELTKFYVASKMMSVEAEQLSERGKKFLKSHQWSAASPFVVDKYCYFQMEINRNGESSKYHGALKKANEKNHSGVTLRTRDKMPYYIEKYKNQRKNSKENIDAESTTPDGDVSITPVSLSIEFQGLNEPRVPSEDILEQAIMNINLENFRFENFEEDCSHRLKSLMKTGEITLEVLEHCSHRPRNFYQMMAKLEEMLRTMQTSNLEETLKFLRSTKSTWFGIMLKILNCRSLSFDPSEKGAVNDEFHQFERLTFQLDKDIGSYNRRLDSYRRIFVQWREQISVIDHCFYTLLRKTWNVNDQDLHSSSEEEANPIHFPETNFSLYFLEDGDNLGIQIVAPPKETNLCTFRLKDCSNVILKLSAISLHSFCRALVRISGQFKYACFELEDRKKDLNNFENYLNPGFKTPKYHSLERAVVVISLNNLQYQMIKNQVQIFEFHQELMTFKKIFQILKSVLAYYNLIQPDNSRQESPKENILPIQLQSTFVQNVISFVTLNPVGIGDPVAQKSLSELAKEIVRRNASFTSSPAPNHNMIAEDDIISPGLEEIPDVASNLFKAMSEESFILNAPFVLIRDPLVDYDAWRYSTMMKLDTIIKEFHELTLQGVIEAIVGINFPMDFSTLENGSTGINLILRHCHVLYSLVDQLSPAHLFGFNETYKKNLQLKFMKTSKCIDKFSRKVKKMTKFVECKLYLPLVKFQNKFFNPDIELDVVTEQDLLREALAIYKESMNGDENNKMLIHLQEISDKTVRIEVTSISHCYFYWKKVQYPISKLPFETQLKIIHYVLDCIHEMFKSTDDHLETLKDSLKMAKNLMKGFWKLYSKFQQCPLYFTPSSTLKILSALKKTMISTLLGYKGLKKLGVEARMFISHSINSMKLWLGEDVVKATSLRSQDAPMISIFVYDMDCVNLIVENLAFFEIKKDHESSILLSLPIGETCVSEAICKVVEESSSKISIEATEPLVETETDEQKTDVQSTSSNQDIRNQQVATLASQNLTPKPLSKYTRKIIENNFITASKYCAQIMSIPICQAWLLLRHPNTCQKLYVCHIKGVLISLLWGVLSISSEFTEFLPQQLNRFNKAIEFLSKSADFVKERNRNVLLEPLQFNLKKIKEKNEEMKNLFLKRNEMIDLDLKLKGKILKPPFKAPSNEDLLKIFSIHQNVIQSVIENCSTKKRSWTAQSSEMTGLVLKQEELSINFCDLTLTEKIDVTVNMIEYLEVFFSQVEIKLNESKNAMSRVKRILQKHAKKINEWDIDEPAGAEKVHKYEESFEYLEKFCSETDKMIKDIFISGENTWQIVDKVGQFCKLKLFLDKESNSKRGQRGKLSKTGFAETCQKSCNDLEDFLTVIKISFPISVMIPLSL